MRPNTHEIARRALASASTKMSAVPEADLEQREGRAPHLVQQPDELALSLRSLDWVATRDGLNLRVARWQKTNEPVGTLVICAGRAEFIEKYYETIADLLARNLVVVAFDWRGQGLSDHELSNRRKGHIDDFSLYERDLDALVEHVLTPMCPQPWFGLAHSMGGTILLEQARHGRSPFARVVLTSPMIGIYGLSSPRLARAVLALLDYVGLGGAFLPGGGGETATITRPFPGNVFTTDRQRHARSASYIGAHAPLGLGDPTIGWTHAAFRLMKQFEDVNYPRQIHLPILIIASGHDRIVDTRATERFAQRLKIGRLVNVPGAEHEILLERDPLRDLFWAAFDAFIPGKSRAVNPNAPAEAAKD